MDGRKGPSIAKNGDSLVFALQNTGTYWCCVPVHNKSIADKTLLLQLMHVHESTLTEASRMLTFLLSYMSKFVCLPSLCYMSHLLLLA